MIDALYEKKCKVVVLAAAAPTALFRPHGHGRWVAALPTPAPGSHCWVAFPGGPCGAVVACWLGASCRAVAFGTIVSSPLRLPSNPLTHQAAPRCVPLWAASRGAAPRLCHGVPVLRARVCRGAARLCGRRWACGCTRAPVCVRAWVCRRMRVCCGGHSSDSVGLRDLEVYDEAFAFDRTVSRLMEMQSEEYLTAPWLGEVGVEDVVPFIVKGGVDPSEL